MEMIIKNEKIEIIDEDVTEQRFQTAKSQTILKIRISNKISLEKFIINRLIFLDSISNRRKIKIKF